MRRLVSPIALVPFLSLLSLSLMGCQPKGPNTPEGGPQLVPELHVTGSSPADLAKRLEAADDKLVRDDYMGAGAAYDEVRAADPEGATGKDALFSAGVAYMGAGELDLAEKRFRESLERFPDADTAKPSILRLSRIFAYAERWTDLELVADQILARKDLVVIEQIEGLGAKSLALVSRGLVDEASKVVDVARTIIDKDGLGEGGVWPLELAQVSFALGEIRRIRSEKIVFDPFPPNFSAALEERATGLLEAQAAYSEAIRAKDAHWSAMSGYRIGELYAKLHSDVTRAPTPPAKNLEQQQLFEGAMRLRYRILLKKGLTMMDRVVQLGDRTGESSEWVHRARDAKKKLEQAIADENAALAKMPFSEAELQKALDEFQAKSKPPAPGGAATPPKQ